MMKILVKAIAVVGILAMVSCHETSAPNYQFFPNMYQSVGYETYSESAAFNDGVAAQLPVEGTVKRGWMPYEIANTIEGRAFAKDSLVSPLKNTDANLTIGKELYDIYCAVCHGNKGKGDGGLVKSEKFLGVPNYADRDITEGNIYHTIYYGLNSMGSHAGQLKENERWQVAMYVSKLKADLTK
jgi:mono/diheme cytochrome c family protein